MRVPSKEVNTAGRLRFFLKEWESITSDTFVLNTIQGYQIDLTDLPLSNDNNVNYAFSGSERTKIKLALGNLLKSAAIERCSPEEGQFTSPIFLVPKHDGSDRFILNLKRFNESVKQEHFKLEDIRSALNLLDNYDFMGRLDLKDAYHLIPISKPHKKFLRFEFEGELFQFNVLPFGLSSAPYVFTKIGRPIANYLRERGVRLIIYLDDFLIFGRTKEECGRNIKLAISLLTFLGFIINWEKSETKPTTRIKFLGMIIDSVKMNLELPPDKKNRIREMIIQPLRQHSISLQNLARLTGVLVSACPAVAYGWLYYKELERLKCRASLEVETNPNKKVPLSMEAEKDLAWWRGKILGARNKIRSDSYDLEIFTDASPTGWGATCGNKKASGRWDPLEMKLHINLLEIKAAFLGLKCFLRDSQGKQVLLRIDNITALAYINKMGGIRHRALNDITKRLWQWCEAKAHWVFAEYVASKDNPADEGSRITNIDTEWELSDYAFERLCASFGSPVMDLFASRVNSKCRRYCSWDRDPYAVSINSLTISWKLDFWYAFPLSP